MIGIRYFSLIGIIVGLLGMGSIVRPTTATLTSIIVDSAADLIDNTDGTCTLREAVTAANDDIMSSNVAGECPAGTELDTITFDLPASSTIDLLGFPITISRTLTIVGGGADDLTIDANQLNRVIHIKPGTAVTLTGMTVTGGRNPSDVLNGAGILNEAGDLVLDDVIVAGNVLTAGSGAGIHTLEGTLTIVNSTIEQNEVTNGNGGGIFSRDSDVVITNSRLVGNQSGDEGGGLFAITSDIQIQNSFFWQNAAAGAGGAIANQSKLTILTSTIADNQAPLGSALLAEDDNALRIEQSTIYNNSSIGAMFAADPLTSQIRNSIVAHQDADQPVCSTPFSGGSTTNLASDASCGFAIVANPLLDSITAAGYYPLQFSSPARDAGNLSICVDSTDQRGFARPSGFNCDLGAYELDTPLQYLNLPFITR